MNIVKNSTNKIALTLTEKATTVNHDWLLKLTNDTVGLTSTRVIALTDIGEYPERANIFLITESGDEDLVNSTVNLSPAGQWTYYAYEMAPSSPRNMNPAQALKMVESGRCLVTDPTEITNHFFNDEEVKNTPVFEG